VFVAMLEGGSQGSAEKSGMLKWAVVLSHEPGIHYQRQMQDNLGMAARVRMAYGE
jgi:hypothetical protein